MRIGQVIGKTTLSDSDPAFRGARWLVVSPLDKSRLGHPPPHPVSAQPSLIVYDNLGAGTGDLIGFVEGAEATQTFSRPTPVDAYNVCLLDRITYQPPQPQS